MMWYVKGREGKGDVGFMKEERSASSYLHQMDITAFSSGSFLKTPMSSLPPIPAPSQCGYFTCDKFPKQLLLPCRK